MENEALTRKSFVVHFTTMRSYERAAHTVLLRDPDAPPGSEPTPRPIASFRVVARDGGYGFESPLKVGTTS